MKSFNRTRDNKTTTEAFIITLYSLFLPVKDQEVKLGLTPLF